jgi:hypothetical protein
LEKEEKGRRHRARGRHNPEFTLPVSSSEAQCLRHLSISMIFLCVEICKTSIGKDPDNTVVPQCLRKQAHKLNSKAI